MSYGALIGYYHLLVSKVRSFFLQLLQLFSDAPLLFLKQPFLVTREV